MGSRLFKFLEKSKKILPVPKGSEQYDVWWGFPRDPKNGSEDWVSPSTPFTGSPPHTENPIILLYMCMILSIGNIDSRNLDRLTPYRLNLNCKLQND